VQQEMEMARRKYQGLMGRVLMGEPISRGDRKDLDTWLKVKMLEELEHICGREQGVSDGSS
jgi:hypothetical protein